MKYKLPVELSIALLLLTGCAIENRQVVEVLNTQLIKEATTTNIYLTEDVTRGKYEPNEGVYLGVDIDHNESLQGDMALYEQMIGKEQAFRVFQYSNEGDLTATQILECIASEQIPYIKVMIDPDYDIMPIYQLVGDLNTRYPTTVFVELFPITHDQIDPLQYLDYYENAYNIIKRYIDDAIIVWSIDWNHVFDSPMYYPGDDQVDWVGLNAVLPRYKEQLSYDPDQATKIDFWYKMFQSEKPLMLSTLAISHFSRIDHTYTIADAKNKMSYFYEDMVETYPRIKGILYSDVAMYQITPEGSEDYRITSQEKLIEHLSTLQANPLFLSKIEEEDTFNSMAPMLYTINAYEIDQSLYVTEEQIEHLYLSKHILREVPCLIDIDMTKYYDLEVLLLEADGWLQSKAF